MEAAEEGSVAAGKSSLLDIISGRRFGEGVEGRLRVDGVTMGPQDVRAMAGYVHQVCPPSRSCPAAWATPGQASPLASATDAAAPQATGHRPIDWCGVRVPRAGD